MTSRPKPEAGKYFFSCFVFYFFLTDVSRKLGLWPRRYLRNGDKWRCADGSFTVPASRKAFRVGKPSTLPSEINVQTIEVTVCQAVRSDPGTEQHAAASFFRGCA